jgi:hypothetical protein
MAVPEQLQPVRGVHGDVQAHEEDQPGLDDDEERQTAEAGEGKRES